MMIKSLNSQINNNNNNNNNQTLTSTDEIVAVGEISKTLNTIQKKHVVDNLIIMNSNINNSSSLSSHSNSFSQLPMVSSYRLKLNNIQSNEALSNTTRNLIQTNQNNECKNLTRRQSIEQTTNEKILNLLIELYNREINYLNLLKNAFEVYAEPLRKFSSLTLNEHQILFSNLEPLVSLSYNLSIKLEKLINNWPCELNNSGKLIGKKFLQSYEEYLINYPQIIKLLNEKYKQDEFREFSDLRQLSNNYSLKDILVAPSTYASSTPNLALSSNDIKLNNVNNLTNNSISPVSSLNLTKSKKKSSLFKSSTFLHLFKSTSQNRLNSIDEDSTLNSSNDDLNNAKVLLGSPLPSINEFDDIDNKKHFQEEDEVEEEEEEKEEKEILKSKKERSSSLFKWFHLSTSSINLNTKSSKRDNFKKFGGSSLSIVESQNKDNNDTTSSHNDKTTLSNKKLKKFSASTLSLLTTNRQSIKTNKKQKNSNSTLSLHKLERVHDYDKSLQSLINITSGASHLSSSSTTSSSAASLTSSSAATTTTTTTTTSYTDILNSNLDYWKKMRDKFETIIQLNHQIYDLDINKLTSLACVQQTFPNDNLNLFEIKSPNDQFLNKSSNQEDTQSIQTLQKKSSFVSKHIQRRKTIHDTLNIDLLKNFLIEKQQNQNDNSLKTSTLNLNSSKQKQLKSESAKNSPISQKLNASVEHLNNLSKTSKQFKSTLALSSISPISPNKNQTKFDFANVLTNNNTTNVLPVLNRELVKQGHVTLSNQYGKQERYLFLFNDLLIIAKQKNENYNKLKYKVYLSDIWISDCFDAIYWQYKADTSFVLGWPASNNFIADFKDTNQKEIWLNKLKELIAIEKQKEEGISINIKICFNKDNLGHTEPTQYSQCYTKTLQISNNETARDIVNRCKAIFNLKSTSSTTTDTSDQNNNLNDYQLWFKTGHSEPLIPLIGHEFPYVIKMNFLRESGKSIKTDDNSLVFTLIDKNPRQSTDLDRLQRFRKRMFGARTNTDAGNGSSHRASSTTLDTSRSNSKSNVSQMTSSTLTKPFSLKPNKKTHLFGVKLEKLCQNGDKLPAPILKLLEKVLNEGYNVMMIFRKSGSAKLNKLYKEKLDNNSHIDYDEMNVHVAALLLKEYLREYPDGVISYDLYPECIKVLKISDLSTKIKSTKSIMNGLSYWNYTCLRYFMCLFYHIASYSAINKMDSQSISVCVAPSLFHKLDRPNNLEMSYSTIAFVRFLIENFEQIFGKSSLNLLKLNAPQLSATAPAVLNTQQTEEQVNESHVQRKIIETLDTDSNDGRNHDSSLDDVIGTSSELETQTLPKKSSLTTTNLIRTACHQDFSSNTLSVDSGLSVPTATSDPESEKSAVSMRKYQNMQNNLELKDINFKRQRKNTIDNSALMQPRSVSMLDDYHSASENIIIVDDSQDEQNVQQGHQQAKQHIFTKYDPSKKITINTQHKYQKKISGLIRKFSESDATHAILPKENLKIPIQRNASETSLLQNERETVSLKSHEEIKRKQDTPMKYQAEPLTPTTPTSKSFDESKPNEHHHQQQQQHHHKSTNKKIPIKINLDYLHHIQSNVLKGINTGIGLAGDIINHAIHSANNQDDNKKASSNVYLPQSTATLTKVTVTGSLDNNSKIARRKSSKSKGDYKISKHLESLQSRSRRDSTNSSCSSSRESVDETNQTIEASSTRSTFKETQFLKPKQKRLSSSSKKNNVLRAKSFNHTILDRPNTNNPNFNAIFNSKAHVKRSISLKTNFYEKNDIDYDPRKDLRVKSTQTEATSTTPNVDLTPKPITTPQPKILTKTPVSNFESLKKSPNHESLSNLAKIVKLAETSKSTFNLTTHLFKQQSLQDQMIEPQPRSNSSSSGYMYASSKRTSIGPSLDAQRKLSNELKSQTNIDQNVTWSVSNIRKKFELARHLHHQNSLSSSPASSLLSINSTNTRQPTPTPTQASLNNTSSLTSQIANTSRRPSKTTIQDYYGNPTTYI